MGRAGRAVQSAIGPRGYICSAVAASATAAAVPLLHGWVWRCCILASAFATGAILLTSPPVRALRSAASLSARLAALAGPARPRTMATRHEETIANFCAGGVVGLLCIAAYASSRKADAQESERIRSEVGRLLRL